MKEIITNIRTLGFLLMAVAAMTACSGDDNDNDITAEQPVKHTPKTYRLTIDAAKGDNTASATRALSLDGKTLNATWAKTENIYVKKDNAWATGTLKPQTDGAIAKLKGTFSSDTDIQAGDELTLQYPKSGDISYAGQVGTLSDISQNYDYATATIQVANVTAEGDINPTVATVNFENPQAIVKFTLKDDVGVPINPTELTVNDGTGNVVVLSNIPAETYTANGADGVLYVALPAISSKTVTISAIASDGVYAFTTPRAVSFDNGQYYAVSVAMKMQESSQPDNLPEGALPGQFAINSNGDKVYFSQGNLQAIYEASEGMLITYEWRWALAANQWDYVGDATPVINGPNSVTSNGNTVDLFCWVGASATNSNWANGIVPANQSQGYGSVAGESLASEWGSKIGEGWRTPGNDEWNYLFNVRNGATVNGITNARYALATIDFGDETVNGVILFPDGITIGTSAADWGTINGASEWGTKCSKAQWIALERKGCVFLPAAGYRENWNFVSGALDSGVRNTGTHGHYWSSTSSTDNSSNAKYLYFTSGELNATAEDTRALGRSVRLIRPVE